MGLQPHYIVVQRGANWVSQSSPMEHLNYHCFSDPHSVIFQWRQENLRSGLRTRLPKGVPGVVQQPHLSPLEVTTVLGHRLRVQLGKPRSKAAGAALQQEG